MTKKAGRRKKFCWRFLNLFSVRGVGVAAISMERPRQKTIGAQSNYRS